MRQDDAPVPLPVARAEAAARAARLDLVVAPLWRAARWWTVAVVLAAFPVLFIVDARVDLPLSPVLPGLGVLLLLILGLPFLLLELASRRYRKRGPEWQALHALRAANRSRAAAGLAAVWLLVWFMVGT